MTKPAPGKFVCCHCGSDCVGCDGSLYWDLEAQEWAIATPYGDTDYCNECEGETSIEWVELTEMEDLMRHAAAQETTEGD